MEALTLKLGHYLSCESHIHLGVMRKAKTNTILDTSRSCSMLGPFLTCGSIVQ